MEWRDEECGVKERKRGGGAQNGTREEAGGREGRSEGRGRLSVEGEDERDGRRESLKETKTTRGEKKEVADLSTQQGES